MKSREKIFRLIVQELKKRGATKVAVFGSYVRGEQTRKSDIDVMVEFSKAKSLLELVRMERELSEVLGIKVDLLTARSISPYIRNKIFKKMVIIYG